MDTINKTIYSKSSYIGLLEILEYIIFIIIIYKYNPFSISSKHPAFSNALTLLVALIYVLLFYFLREKISLGQDIDSVKPSEWTFLIKVLSTLGFFIVSVFIIKYFAILITTGKTGLLTLFRYSILFLAIVSGLAILYTVFQPIVAKLGRSGKIGSFIVKLVMYTPCLLLALVDYFKNQYNITTKPVWLLLLAELILIVLWVIVPMLLSYYVSRNGVQLLKEPKYLNGENVVGTFDELYGAVVNSDVNTISQPKFNYHYSLSAWFYINPQPPNTSPAYNKYTNILNYGGKPTVEFNGQLNSLRISVDTQQEENGNKKIVQLFETKKVLFQRWNNIVINYDRGTMDVFLNAELVGSRPSIAPYMTYESINVGAINGIHGGISNVMYYKDNLSRSYIELMYQALRGKEEPFL